MMTSVLLEVHGAALAVGEAAVVRSWSSTFSTRGAPSRLVEQDHRVRSAPHRFGERAALLVAHVAGGAPIMRATVCFSWYSLMSSRTIACSSSNRNSASARELGLADTRRAEEQERTDRRFGSCSPARAPAHGLGHSAHRLVLADDALVQALLHLHELLHLTSRAGARRDAGPLRHDLGDVLLVHLFLEHALLLLHDREPRVLLVELALEQEEIVVADARDGFEVALTLGARLVDLQPLALGLELADARAPRPSPSSNGLRARSSTRVGA
jgi:hypothetical protein